MTVQDQPGVREPLRLHIGGETVKQGWKIVNVKPLPGVDYIGSATDLSAFADATVDEVYGSHIYEHLTYSGELLQALREAYRVLRPGGMIRIGVPDLTVLCRLFLSPDLSTQERFWVMRLIYGGQTDDWDYHKGGYSADLLGEYLHAAGFREITHVDRFGIFEDTTTLAFRDTPISLNLQATKPVIPD
jgi:predicted SAM-dependent methyltransferase